MQRTCSLPIRRPRSLDGGVLSFLRFALLLAIVAACGCATKPSPRIDRVVTDGWKFIRADVADLRAEINSARGRLANLEERLTVLADRLASDGE